MRGFLLAVCAAATLVGAVRAQTTHYSVFRFDNRIPRVHINSRSAALQASVLPRLYEHRSERRDMQWVARHDSALVAFWQTRGDTVLHVMTELAGIDWQENEFDIYLVRYYPSLGASDPLILPIGGIGDGVVTEAAPVGSQQELNLIFQLARRMLAQANCPENGVRLGISYHPLMRPGPYRFDNLALLLALATADVTLGLDSTFNAYRSAFWVNRTPGRHVFETYLKGQWNLDVHHPLAQWIAAEPYGSELVLATRAPQRLQGGSQRSSRTYVEGLPLKGQFGFSASLNSQGRLVVDKMDTFRLAYACGLREGDEIHKVDGERVRHHREFVELALERMRSGAATIEVMRNGDPMLVLLQPMGLEPDEFYGPPGFEYYDVPVDTLDLDSLYMER